MKIIVGDSTGLLKGRYKESSLKPCSNKSGRQTDFVSKWNTTK